MKIIVCVKQVPDTSGKVAVNPDGTLNRASMAAITNPDDLNAVEAALTLKEQTGAEVVIVSMGPPPAESMLREVMARGADRAVLVSAREFGGSDTYATSQILAAAINKIGVEDEDIVLCGRQAIDGDTAQVGPQIAEKLHLPQVSYVAAAHPTPKTAVIVHGYTDNAVRMLMIGYLYNKEMDFNILLPDLYGHGMSEGNHAQMGWKDRLDVLQWTETADELFGRRHTDSVASRSTEMVVHGISMGAATTMMVSGEVEHGQYQQPFIKCFVEDCGYTSVWDEFRGELKAQFNLPAFPLLHTANWLCRQEYGWDFLEASALEQVKKCTLPMLFIHGDADTFVPTWMVYPLYEAKPEPKELWIVPGATHAMSYKDYPQEYTEHVKKFVGKYIH